MNLRKAKDHAEAVLTAVDDNLPSKVIEHANAILEAMGGIPVTLDTSHYARLTQRARINWLDIQAGVPPEVIVSTTRFKPEPDA